jgi:NADPH-dependent 2,4-dienoyl-CoA reductase/sulfur reductase-like enzyme
MTTQGTLVPPPFCAYNNNMFRPQHRQQTWAALTTAPLDLLVIGGGITGAGIAREAARLGLRVGLVEQADFAWGTSSRSSKLVHGGLRYRRGPRRVAQPGAGHQRQRSVLSHGRGRITVPRPRSHAG